jgi:DNA-binding NtrC family response regulator
MPKQTLLVVDDEPNIVSIVSETLASPKLRVLSAETAARGIRTFSSERPDAVLLDLRLPDMSGLDTFDIMSKLDPRTPIVIMTALARTETAIDAMSRGAFECLIKPVDLQRLKQTIAHALGVSRLSRRPALIELEDNSSDNADQIVGDSSPMQDVYKAIARVAPQESVVLIQGERGTGKELVARAIYHYSRRSNLPFHAINCSALPETRLESELFGHERGAFTGGDQRRIGKFEQVNGGTIFLDEIGDMSPATQSKTVRLLQEHQFERLGGNSTLRTDVRIIAGTTQDLAQAVATGRFRQDLSYRLNGFTIRLPALRERKEDIPLLIDHFVRRFARESSKEVPIVDEDARTALMAYDWPGNVRELESAIRYAVLNATNGAVTHDCLPGDFLDVKPRCINIKGDSASPGPEFVTRVRELIADGRGDVYRRILAEFDEAVIRVALEHTRGNQSQSAALLGLSRMTLRAKIRSRLR